MTTLDQKYRNLLIDILQEGRDVESRNGKTKLIPSYSFTVDFQESPFISLRKFYPKGVLGEFTTLVDPTPLINVEQFEANGCNYWDLWSGKHGELKLGYHEELHPQLEEVIQNIKDDPHSRRHVINLWNHDKVQANYYSLPSCWYGMSFTVIEGTLHMTWIERSVDVAVGLPSDIYLAFLFMDYICSLTNLDYGTCMLSLSNVHIYEEHLPGVYELLIRESGDDRPIKFELKV